MLPPENDTPVPVALVHCEDYAPDSLRKNVFDTLEAARISISGGMRILLKPNLLQAMSLACTSPELVRALCEWLLDHNAKVHVADSPGFGRAGAVARAIGLEDVLKPLDVKVEQLDQPVNVALPLFNPRRPVSLMVSRKALETDLIISLPRVKAHSQMRLTLAVKNCFGCVSSMRKALMHARYGEDVDFFADCLCALWAALPPVAAVADGIVAMHVTGPSKGKPFHLALLGASVSAPALDKAIMRVLDYDAGVFPIAKALKRRAENGDNAADPEISFPLEKPEYFSAPGFIIPERLVSASFNPFHLLKSICRRTLAGFRDRY